MLKKLGVVLWLALCVGCGSSDAPNDDDEDIDHVGDLDADGGDGGADGGGADSGPDAAGADADGDLGDAGDGDEPPELPLNGFGQISNDCPSIIADMATSANPSLVRVTLDFNTDEFDQYSELGELTAGAQAIYAAGTASSTLSEVFAFEVLNRCDLATLVKTEDAIAYIDDTGERADFSVSIQATTLGVAVARAVQFPFGEPYAVSDASELLQQQLDDANEANANVAPDDAWRKHVLVVVAWDSDAADSVAAAWSTLDAATRADTIVYVITTDGEDMPIYESSP